MERAKLENYKGNNVSFGEDSPMKKKRIRKKHQKSIVESEKKENEYKYEKCQEYVNEDSSTCETTNALNPEFLLSPQLDQQRKKKETKLSNPQKKKKETIPQKRKNQEYKVPWGELMKIKHIIPIKAKKEEEHNLAKFTVRNLYPFWIRIRSSYLQRGNEGEVKLTDEHLKKLAEDVEARTDHKYLLNETLYLRHCHPVIMSVLSEFWNDAIDDFSNSNMELAKSKYKVKKKKMHLEFFLRTRNDLNNVYFH